MADYPRSLAPALRPLEPLLDDPTVTELHVNGPAEVWVRRSGRLERTDVVLASSKIGALVDALARAVDAPEEATCFGRRFEEGLRVEVVRPPLSPDGPVVTLSRPPAGPATLDDLVAEDGLTREAYDLLTGALGDRKGILVAGRDRLARQTLLVALAGDLPEAERVVWVETGEVHPPDHPHLIRLRAGEGGPSSLSAALRLGVDRLVCGEVAPGDVAGLLLDAGDAFAGALVAVGASTADAAVARVVALAGGAGGLSGPAAPLLAAEFGLVVVCGEGRASSPRVLEIAELGVDASATAPTVQILFRRAPGEEVATPRTPRPAATATKTATATATATHAHADSDVATATRASFEAMPKPFRTAVEAVSAPTGEDDTIEDEELILPEATQASGIRALVDPDDDDDDEDDDDDTAAAPAAALVAEETLDEIAFGSTIAPGAPEPTVAGRAAYEEAPTVPAAPAPRAPRIRRRFTPEPDPTQKSDVGTARVASAAEAPADDGQDRTNIIRAFPDELLDD